MIACVREVQQEIDSGGLIVEGPLRALLSCCDELRLDDQAGGDVSRLLQELPQRERFRLGGRPKTSQLVANRADFICAEETRPQMFVNGRGFLTGEHVPAVE